MWIDPPGNGLVPHVRFWGAARSVTGSMHLVEAGGRRILLDCGLARGPRLTAHLRNRAFPFEPRHLDAVVLSHAHIDHCGNLPNLVRQGFTGPIYCTPATRELLAVILADSSRIQEEEALVRGVLADETGRQPLYTYGDAHQAVAQCVALTYGERTAIDSSIELVLTDAGHVLGSAVTSLTLVHAGQEHRLTFTGDIGRRGLPFLPPPAPLPAADLIVCESTYGGRRHPSLARMTEVMTDVVRRTIERGGKVLIPAFSLGRTQLVVHYLQQWMRSGQTPAASIYVDSPLAADVALVHHRHAASLTTEAAHAFAELAPGVDAPGPLVRYVRSAEDSRRLSTQRGPCIIVAASGMCEGGRILQHLEQNLDDPRASVVLVSYQAPRSIGRRLMEPRPTIRFRGRSWNLWAEVVDVQGFSGHADQDDLLAYLRPLAERKPRIRLVHGEVEQQQELTAALQEAGFDDVEAPELGILTPF